LEKTIDRFYTQEVDAWLLRFDSVQQSPKNLKQAISEFATATKATADRTAYYADGTVVETGKGKPGIALALAQEIGEQEDPTERLPLMRALLVDPGHELVGARLEIVAALGKAEPLQSAKLLKDVLATDKNQYIRAQSYGCLGKLAYRLIESGNQRGARRISRFVKHEYLTKEFGYPQFAARCSFLKLWDQGY
jgi:hypothetical protein